MPTAARNRVWEEQELRSDGGPVALEATTLRERYKAAVALNRRGVLELSPLVLPLIVWPDSAPIGDADAASARS